MKTSITVVELDGKNFFYCQEPLTGSSIFSDELIAGADLEDGSFSCSRPNTQTGDLEEEFRVRVLYRPLLEKIAFGNLSEEFRHHSKDPSILSADDFLPGDTLQFFQATPEEGFSFVRYLERTYASIKGEPTCNIAPGSRLEFASLRVSEPA